MWALAEAATPQQGVAVYTQAVMDLGATVCTRRRPACALCPLTESCSARRSGRQHELPAPKPRARGAARPSRRCWLLFVRDAEGGIFLERRPERGIWGGLWCPPEFASATAATAWAQGAFPKWRGVPQALTPVAHAFTHFDLEIVPLLLEGAPPSPSAAALAAAQVARAAGIPGVADSAAAPPGLWYNPRAAGGAAAVGLPAPVRLLLDGLTSGIL
jgi:A/G-specific adenine glycosylase